MRLAWKQFNDLCPESLYAFLRLRSEVFVVEQNCAYQDLDNLDQAAWHGCYIDHGSLLGYIRILPPDPQSGAVRIGRVVLAKSARGKNLGGDLFQQAVAFARKCYPGHALHLSAQYGLSEWYAQFGFQAQGEPYLEDGIVHISMFDSAPTDAV